MQNEKNVSNSDTKQEKTELQGLIEEAVEHKMEEVGRRLILAGKKTQKNWTKMTMKRLYSYPILKANIERYRKDIDDIRKEDMGKSKSIVEFHGDIREWEKPDVEDLRAAKIHTVEMKIDRDTREVREIEVALDSVRADQYYPIIEMKFFQHMTHEEIADKIPCGVTTVSRQLGRLLDIINVTLYGADALAR
ncbi:hypothetical protein SELR_11170 [Selenomonas ruminantium subsp. lactilytica TAM6421]|uniref:Uncharacterized protein n=1 Tax=Selenomonas ruminantium subsp. lactilytica (strain NBRC 103574 / TAM6421) TaxID=927704 RepID=I0GPY8_SELRL|nr:hypothetical protein [Selenomonas ruminantium]BAL82825.1 hypothetical protein SELR_11170 [Selenomonas ruminantium subsp. lactilytica TAM6421]